MTASADWSARPGHVAVAVDDNFVVFGGFGLSTDPMDPFRPSIPVDMWVSEDGVSWELLDDGVWGPAEKLGYWVLLPALIVQGLATNALPEGGIEFGLVIAGTILALSLPMLMARRTRLL